MNTATTLLASLTIALLTAVVYHMQPQPKPASIVHVDIGQMVDRKIKALTNNGSTEAENERAIQAFGRQLERILKQVSHEKNLIILPSQAVIAGATDYTDVMRGKLNQ